MMSDLWCLRAASRCRLGLFCWWRTSVVMFCLVLPICSVGCGTTRMSDTLRTGTEQVLISTAIDRSINDMDFSLLEGKDVYFDPQYLKGASDEGYIVSSMRQKLLAAGVYLKSNREQATYVVEARAGAVGTNRQDVLLGIPQTNLPTSAVMGGVPSVIPEIPLAKSTHQRGVAKLAAFAYNQVTGQAVWQSGSYPITADSRDTWVLGTGPFQRGTIYDGTNFAGQRVMWPTGGGSKEEQRPPAPGLSVTASSMFGETPGLVPPSPPAAFTQKSAGHSISPASFTPAVPPSQPQPGRVPVLTPPTSTTSAGNSGFTSNTFGNPTTSDPKLGSGGSAAAAGLMILGNGSRE